MKKNSRGLKVRRRPPPAFTPLPRVASTSTNPRIILIAASTFQNQIRNSSTAPPHDSPLGPFNAPSSNAPTHARSFRQLSSSSLNNRKPKKLWSRDHSNTTPQSPTEKGASQHQRSRLTPNFR